MAAVTFEAGMIGQKPAISVKILGLPSDQTSWDDDFDNLKKLFSTAPITLDSIVADGSSVKLAFIKNPHSFTHASPMAQLCASTAAFFATTTASTQQQTGGSYQVLAPNSTFEQSWLATAKAIKLPGTATKDIETGTITISYD